MGDVSRPKRTPAAGRHYDLRAKWIADGKPLKVGPLGHVMSGELERLGLDVQVTEWAFEGRSQIKAIEVRSDRALTSNLLRAIPLAEIERERDGGWATAKAIAREMTGFDALAELKQLLGDLPTGERRRVPARFYELVASVYLAQVRYIRAPSAVIAKETGTPLPTVQGWVRRARLRGLLPPARRGSAG